MDLFKKIELMEEFTSQYKSSENMEKSLREIKLMKIIFPEVFTPPLENDLFVGRFVMLPVGHGLEWAHLGGGNPKTSRDEEAILNGSSVPELNSAGPSYYGLINQLETMKKNTNDSGLSNRIKKLIDFWSTHDTHIQMVKQFSKTHASSLYSDDINNFLPPFLTMTRLSGIEMDYDLLLNKGVLGFKDYLNHHLYEDEKKNDFIAAGIEAIELLESSIHYYIDMLNNDMFNNLGNKNLIINSLHDLLNGRPSSFHSAMQLMFLYSQLAGVVNYGRMDDYLGEFLITDLNKQLIDESTAIKYIISMWHFINECCNRGNGRVIIGGQGRKNPKAANVFARLAIKATMQAMIVKPQLTLRLDETVTEDIYDLALDAIGKGCTFPMLYNDSLNVPSVAKAMNVNSENAMQYVPYGCGEYIIYGCGTGSPNACVNFTKVLQLALNQGIDPYDDIYRGGDYNFKDITSLKSYEEVEKYYFDYLDYVLMTTIHFQHDSYQYMTKRSSFVFASLLMHDCISRKKPILDGGIRYYSGVNEFYGFSNAIDSLQAIKTIVFDEQKATLKEVVDAIKTNFEKDNGIKATLLSAPKFGNDIEQVDQIGVKLHEHACNYIRDHAKDVGLYSFLAVNINNNANTRWGMKTGASFDGRVKGEHLAPGNNPHSGRDHNGITAMLNSISKFRADIHAGYVQNLKCSPRLFNEEREKLKLLLKTYYNQIGGTQLMINVVDQKTLLDAKAHPENYQNLIVRCGGFSAKFVELDENTQLEIISRTSND